jgi:hypothetical protein
MLLVGILGSCSKQGAPDVTNNAPGPLPFKNETYRTLNNDLIVTITSPDELELSQNGVNLICKYTKQDNNTLRVVINSFGTTQALYYRISPDGLVNANGGILFNQAAYARVQEEIRKENERQVEYAKRAAKSKEKSREVESLKIIQAPDCTCEFDVVIMISDVGYTVSGGRAAAQGTYYFADIDSVSKITSSRLDNQTWR